MTAVWYVGSSDVRTITSADWTAAGITGSPATVTWNKANGWSVPALSFTAPQIALMAALPEFNTTGADGPRTGASTGATPDQSPVSKGLLTALLSDPNTTEMKNQRALRRYHYALGARDSEPLDVFFAAGDSLFASAGASTFAATLAQKFAKYHRQQHPQVAVGGFGNMNYIAYGSGAAGVWPDTPVGYQGSASYSAANGVPGWGLDAVSTALSGAGKNVSATFVGTGADVCWFSSGAQAGSGTLTVDGTTYGVYNSGTKAITAGAGTFVTAVGNNVISHGKIRGLTAGTHTVTWTWASGTFFVNSSFVYNGDENSGVRVAVAATSGRGTRNYIGVNKGGAVATNPLPTQGQAEQWRQSIRDGSYLPDLIFLDNMANDYAGTAADVCTPAENLANLQGIIANMKADVAVGATAAGVTSYIPSFVVIPPHCVISSSIGSVESNGGTMVANWTDYVANAYTIASADPDGAVGVFDLGQRLQGYSNVWDASSYGGLLWTDKVHPGDAGNDWWARALVEFVRPK